MTNNKHFVLQTYPLCTDSFFSFKTALCQGVDAHNLSLSGGGTVDNRSVMSRMSSATRGGGDDVWYDNEYKLDDKGKKKPVR